jgi:Outer membrane protein beta-barrel domain
MYNSEFEKQVQQKMEELKMTPSDNLWDRIEKDLPSKPPHRNKAILLLLLLVCISGLTWMVNHFYNREINSIKKETVTGRTDTVSSAQKTTGTRLPAVNNDSLHQGNDMAKDATPQNAPQAIQPSSDAAPGSTQHQDNTAAALHQNQLKQKEKPLIAGTKKDLTIADNSISTNKKTVDNGAQKKDRPAAGQSVKNKARAKVSVTQQGGTAEATMQPVADETLAAAVQYTAEGTRSKAADMNKDLRPGKKISTKEAALNALAKSDNKSSKKRWEYGITLSAGLGKQVSNLLATGNNLFGAVSNNVVGPTAVADSFRTGLSGAKPSAAFDAGFYLRRQLSKKWSIQTGLSYSFLSYKRAVGQQVDSGVVYIVNNQPVSATRYYRQSNVQDYVNRLHTLQIPFEVQYNIGKKGNWRILGGLSAGYLLGSNALVYKNNPPVYLTSKDAFNKLLLSMHTGISYQSQGRLPFSAGLRFSYSATSFVKKDINDQHLLSSVLFLNIPLKK